MERRQIQPGGTDSGGDKVFFFFLYIIDLLLILIYSQNTSGRRMSFQSNCSGVLVPHALANYN